MPEPADSVLDHAISIYTTKIHLQPVPLFGLNDLFRRISRSPSFLRSSFLAVCLRFASPDEAEDNSRAVQKTVTSLACEGKVDLQVLQSLILLTLNDLMGKNRHYLFRIC